MKILIFVSVLAVSISVPVWAQESPTPGAYEIRSRIKGGVQQFRQNIEGIKEERREAGGRLEEAREKAKEEIEAKRAELKERLQKVRDEQKKRIVERLDQQLNALNERMMKHFSVVLEKLEKALVNIESRIDKAEANGLDVSLARSMVVRAEDAIAAVKSAIEAQAAKTYTPEISGEEGKLKVEVGRARQLLHSDISLVREKVRAAYEAVRQVATTLAQIPRVNEEPEESPSPTVSPSPTPTP